MAAKKKFDNVVRTIVAMEQDTYDQACHRAWQKHLTFSGLVRELLDKELRKEVKP